jgi:hypothetical protein
VKKVVTFDSTPFQQLRGNKFFRWNLRFFVCDRGTYTVKTFR